MILSFLDGHLVYLSCPFHSAQSVFLKIALLIPLRSYNLRPEYRLLLSIVAYQENRIRYRI